MKALKLLFLIVSLGVLFVVAAVLTPLKKLTERPAPAP